MRRTWLRLRAQSGRTITLALEPEPMCYLETIEEAASFFETQLFCAICRAPVLPSLTRLDAAAAEEPLRRHLGVCYDVCHAAVEFEGAAQSLARLARAGIGIIKLQLSAALKVPRVDARTVDKLRRFDDGVYLHQVVERRADGTSRPLSRPGPGVRQHRSRRWGTNGASTATCRSS